MKIKNKILLNAIGTVDGYDCILDLNKLKKLKLLKEENNSISIYLPDCYADIDDITYKFSYNYFDKKLDIVAYNHPHKKKFNICFYDCQFVKDLSVLANNVYFNHSHHDYKKKIKIQADNIIFKNTNFYDISEFDIKSCESIENKTTFIKCSIDSNKINIYDENIYSDSQKNYCINIVNSIISSRNIFEPTFNYINIKNSKLDVFKAIKLHCCKNSNLKMGNVSLDTCNLLAMDNISIDCNKLNCDGADIYSTNNIDLTCKDITLLETNKNISISTLANVTLNMDKYNDILPYINCPNITYNNESLDKGKILVKNKH